MKSKTSVNSTLHPADVDGDPDLIVNATDKSIVWYESMDSKGRFGLAQTVVDSMDFPSKMRVADVDGDFDLDLFYVGGGKVREHC